MITLVATFMAGAVLGTAVGHLQPWRRLSCRRQRRPAPSRPRRAVDARYAAEKARLEAARRSTQIDAIQESLIARLAAQLVLDDVADRASQRVKARFVEAQAKEIEE